MEVAAVYVIAVVAILTCWRVARAARYQSLVRLANQRLAAGRESLQQSGKLVEKLTGGEVSALELGAYGGLTAAEFVWTWSTIDPSLIAAADFSSVDHIHSGLDFVQYVHDNLQGLSAAAQEGFLHRLAGYYAEQQVTHALESAGHLVQIANSANQPVWDLIVDGQLVNVKDVVDIASIKADALAHKEVVFLVPHDAHGEAVGNIVRMDGFSHEAIKDSLHDGVAAAKGEAAMHGLFHHIPVFTIALSAYKNGYQVVREGKDIGAAAQHFAKESIAKGASIPLGAKVGAIIGSMFSGAGTAIGAVLGAVGAGILGGRLAAWWKSKPLLRAIDQLEEALTNLGRSLAGKTDDIRRYALAPMDRLMQAESTLMHQFEMRSRRLRYIIWPDAYTVFLEQAIKIGRRNISDMRRRIEKITWILDAAEKNGDWKLLGLLAATEPNLRQVVDVDPGLLAAVNDARQETHKQRRYLNPKFEPPQY